MDADVGAPMASAFPPLARKRDLGWHGSGIPQPNWSSRMWTWDSRGFLARPVDPADAENLSLRLGGVVHAEETPVPAATPRPAKRVRSGSPGGGGNYPMCQVDDCGADLSGAKDYHRRHKVCEVHSKTTKALVGKQMQRFCQQCSRFHPLSEFDEGKRSCRRRLAGHNRRRRKTQSEDASSQLVLPGNRENTPNRVLDVLNILSMLARLQGNGADKAASAVSAPDKDSLINIISKIDSMPSNNLDGKSSGKGKLDLNVPQTPVTTAKIVERNGTSSGPPTMDLLAVLSSALKSSKPEAASSQSQGSSACTAEDKENASQLEPAIVVNSCNQVNASFFPTGIVGNRCTLQSTLVAADPIPDLRSKSPLQLFSSTDDDSPPKTRFVRKYLSSESSNPMEERSPISSPPVIRTFFPMNSEVEKNDLNEDVTLIEASTNQQWSSSFELLKKSERRDQNEGAQSMHYHAGYSSSGSDHSPSSSNSYAHDRTGRIVFKLFDKSPSDMPPTLRTQIFNWLSHIPSEMESYIRPGCVVLSLYLSMSSIAWDELKEELSHRVSLLLQSDESQFWRGGRFLVFAEWQLASHKDGRIRFCKSWKTWSSPEIMSVSPLAVVSGKETPITLRGRNLTVPGTKIHCTYMGGYTSKEVLGSMHEGTLYDDSSLESFNFPSGPPDVLGRCFIEVENGFKGNSFPVIIANDSICQELRFLESELENIQSSIAIVDDQSHNRIPKSRENILHFLNELGWLFQRKNPLSNLSIKDFSCTRFKFLLVFAVERDWFVLTAKLLDLLAERSSEDNDLARESLEAVAEIQLLSRAVKRKCRVMVDLLVSYSVTSDVMNARVYIFPPNTADSDGLTPLHIAASCKECEDMVDALTNDPQQIGLNCWSSCTDNKGHSPYDCAAMENNNSYNELVARKLSDLKNHQVSIIVDGGKSLDKSQIVRGPDRENIHPQSQPSCAHCAVVEYRRCGGPRHSPALLRRPYIHSMLAIAAVCVCVCLFLRGAPQLGTVAPFKWENVDYGPQ